MIFSKHSMSAVLLFTTLSAPLSLNAAAQTDAQAEQGLISDETKQAFQDGWREGRLEATYLLNTHLDGFSLDVEIEDKTAILSGDVSSEIEKELAEEIAQGMDGIENVENQIKVTQVTASESARTETEKSFLGTLEDASITASIKTKLLRSNSIKAMDVNVDTDAATVTLEGEVESEIQKELAGRIAANTQGVNRVQNQLVVHQSEQMIN
ncbi:periplasmic or secreted lipoprotein [Oleiphilus messinensis]|uniref:Periplasmic or secreted lipoprotein n=1 Tax=Oleiphilus messinensis TaxID=141451 RepID=A0A1Y0IF35_9GAMM|nr:BON domain-containing protein [Oleiphilus messinensis]ARU59071.1 periplasmic or secreted lipoprotein [Oleiphilus messinensis]